VSIPVSVDLKETIVGYLDSPRRDGFLWIRQKQAASFLNRSQPMGSSIPVVGSTENPCYHACGSKRKRIFLKTPAFQRRIVAV
jgi:hypothetical protein